ncbi:hypothetical protein C8R43DRAFT_975051 [Mycena crocata]|nr:hypothetical protein C8R43DRAFT_975051 [Mycena crocata]
MAFIPADPVADVRARRATRDRIEALDFHIASLKATMRTIKLQRHTLQGELDDYVYPVLTLPNDVISEIFLQSLDSDDASPSGPASPLFLGHICRAWREITLSTPRLWSIIDLKLNAVDTHHNLLCLLEVWLSRSRDCPLSICISTNVCDVSTRAFIEAIVPHCGRWEHVALAISYADLVLIKREMPLLRNSELLVTDHYQAKLDSSAPVQVFEFTPKLQEATLHAINPHFIIFPWKQLTSITASAQYPHLLRETLRLCLNVRYFKVDLLLYASLPVWMAAIPPVQPLTDLQTVIVSGGGHSFDGLRAGGQLLGGLRLPGLRYLSIEEPSAPRLPSWLSQWGCQMSSLSIEIREASSSHRHYRELLPSVKTLRVQHGPRLNLLDLRGSYYESGDEESDDTDASSEEDD